MLDWGEKNKRSFPWRKNRTPYKVLLSEILLQRTPATRVALFFPKFVENYPTLESIANADMTRLRKFFRPMGLHKRVEWLFSLMRELRDTYNCKIPDEEEKLVKLPGIGLYTARALLCFGFGKAVSIVDINVARVLSRVFKGSDAEKRPNDDKTLWSLATKIIPNKFGIQYNESLLDFAIAVCKKDPLCAKCPITNLCSHNESLSG